MNRCPYCGAEARTGWAEVKHMETEHPEIIAERLERAGFVRIGNRWSDRFSDATALTSRPEGK